MSDAARSGGTRSISLVYALATLGAVALGVVAFGGGSERTWGMFSAWLIQAVAFWRLGTALGTGSNAFGPWVGGVAARAGGLIVTGAPALMGIWSSEVPVAYGLTTLMLLLAEAGWLAVRGPGGSRPGRARGNRIERTHSTG